jgi:DNA-binding SARP family transcriptional activator
MRAGEAVGKVPGAVSQAAVFRVLGPLEVVRGASRAALGGPRPRALLSRLLLAPGRVVGVGRLIDDLWDGAPPASGVNTLQSYISLLRRALGDADQSLLVHAGEGYKLDIEPGAVDVTRFEQHVADGRAAAVAGEHAEAVVAFDAGLALWRGAALADVADRDWALGEAARLEELRARVVEERADVLLALGQHAALVPELEAAVAEQPLRERRSRQLALALYRTGRQAEALRALDRVRRDLFDELSLAPTSALVELEHGILRHHPALAPPRPAVAPAVVPAPQPWRLPLPPAADRSPVPFVGRRPDRAWLRQVWERIIDHEPRLVVLEGEPGIGKTRLAGAFAAEVHAQGALVLWGSSSLEPATWYQPLVEALRDLAAALPPDELDRLLEGRAPVRLLVDVTRPGDADREGRADVDRAEGFGRFRLFEAVASLLAALAETAPVLFVIDDIDAIGSGTSSLLAHLLHHPRPARLMLLGTARGIDPGPAHEALMADLRSDHLLERRRLEGLPVDDIAELLQQLQPSGAGAADATVPAEMLAATGGNPFFIQELVAERQERTGASAGTVPEGVRDVLDRRLARLGDEVVGLLVTATLLGPTFDADVLEAVAGLDDATVLDRLDRACASGLVVEVPETVGRYAFAHALVRQTLGGRLSRTRRAQLHLAVAEVYERDPDARGEVLAEIARHRLAALPAGHPRAALDAAKFAGRRALEVKAYEQAADLAAQAITVLEVTGVGIGQGGIDAWCVAHVELLWANALYALGDYDSSAGHYQRAAELARLSGEADVLVEAALGRTLSTTVGVGFNIGVVDREAVELLEEALLRTPDDVGDIRLRAALALALYFDDDLPRRETLGAQAVRRAEQLDDPRLLAVALHARAVASWRPATTPERETVVARAVALAEREGDLERALRFRTTWVPALVELGRVQDAAREIAHMDDLVERLRQPGLRYLPLSCHAALLLLQGRFAEAEKATNAVFDTRPLRRGVNPMIAYAVQGFLLAWERGTLADLAPIVAENDDPERLTLRRLGAIVALADGGHLDLARRRYADEREEPFRDDAVLLPVVVMRAELAHRFDDRANAGHILATYWPYAGRLAQFGTLGCFGPMARALGLAGATVGDVDAAEAWLARAADQSSAVGALAWRARALTDRARLLTERDHGDDARTATRISWEARRIVRSLGMGDPATPRYG